MRQIQNNLSCRGLGNFLNPRKLRVEDALAITSGYEKYAVAHGEPKRALHGRLTRFYQDFLDSEIKKYNGGLGLSGHSDSETVLNFPVLAPIRQNLARSLREIGRDDLADCYWQRR